MISLNAPDLRRLPVEGLQWMRDLIVFDSPLLSEYSHPRGDRFLYYWCDSDAMHTRWMLFRISESTSLRLANGLLSLDAVIPGNVEDDFVYFVDCDAANEVSHVWMVDKDDIEEAYKPSRGAFLEPQTDHDEGSFVVVLDDYWEGQSLFKFEKNLRNCYAFLYAQRELALPNFGSLPFRGGFSGMHSNNAIWKQIPLKDRMNLSAVQYASPGFMRFDAVRSTADEVAFLVSRVADAGTGKVEFERLSAYIRENQLRQLEGSELVDGMKEQWSSHEKPIRTLTRELAVAICVINADQFIDSTNGVFQAAQLLRWFYRRIEELASKLKKGMAYFPRAVREDELLAQFNLATISNQKCDF